MPLAEDRVWLLPCDAGMRAMLLISVPVGAPSSAGIRRGKARMSEAMDGRVRAGRRIPSNAGNIDGFIVNAQTSGVLSFG